MTWKSFICPSMDRYIVIGDIAMRLRSVIPLSVYGLNKSGTDGSPPMFVHCRIGGILVMRAGELFVESLNESPQEATAATNALDHEGIVSGCHATTSASVRAATSARVIAPVIAHH